MKAIKKITEKTSRPIIVVYILSIALITTNLILTAHIRPYSSDDVSWQTILRSWRPFSGKTITLGASDNFVDKLPYFMFFNHFFGESRHILTIESVILALIGFSLFYIAMLYFLKKAGVKINYLNLLPFVWLASFGHSFSELYLDPIWRGFEMGLYFLILMLVAKILYGDINPLKSAATKIVSLLTIIIVGILIYSDPYFLYFFFGPIIIFTLIIYLLKKINKVQLSIILIGALCSLIFSKITSLISIKAGIHMAVNYPVQFINFNQLSINILQSLHSILIIFGADFFGKQAISLDSLSSIVNTLLIIMVAIGAYLLIKYIPHRPQFKTVTMVNLWTIFFVALSMFTLALYTLSTVSDGVSTYRYLIILVLLSVFILAKSLQSIASIQNLLGFIIISAIFLNIITSFTNKYVFALPGSYDNNHNSANYDILNTLNNNNLTKGYANYWQANIDTYLSNNTINVLPVYCQSYGVKEFHWLLEDARFNNPSQSSFYIFDPTLPEEANCTPSQFYHQFGAPEKSLSVDGRTILIYDYDVGSKF